MNTITECTPCLIQQGIKTGRMLNMPSEASDAMTRNILSCIAEADWKQPPPALAKYIYRIIAEHSGVADPFKKIKHQYNTELMSIIDELRDIVTQSDDPFTAALKLAVSGNIIDFGTQHEFSKNSIMQQIDTIEHKALVHDDSLELKKELTKARTLLYLGDNCGEIVFDRVFIEYLKREYKNLDITFVVRGAPVLNDITLTDAEETGMTDLVEVIDNGNDAPGTILKDSSKEFQSSFSSADLIISKGQGNFECLNQAERNNIFFLFMAKCPPVAAVLDVNLMSLICRNIERIQPSC